MKKDKPIVRYTRDNLPEDDTDWERVRNLTDEEIEEAARSDPDAAPIAAADFWKDARVVIPGEKERVTMRIDRDTLDWFRRQGRGYQTRINAVLRAYVEARRRGG